MQGPQQPCQSATLEQSGISGTSEIAELPLHQPPGSDDHTNPRLRDDQSSNKEKLQFTADSNLANRLCTGASSGLVAGTSDGLCEGQKMVAEDEPPIQVLVGNGYNLEYDETEHSYEGDIFPGHLPDGKLRYLQKMYKAVPEEFYSKSKKTPVTPRNARSWMRKRRGSIFHFWEWCSGSGRLSLIALLSGLCVLFPIDYRYGWDLSHPEHQRIIQEIEHDINESP